MSPTKYKLDSETVSFQGKEIVVENRSPIFAPEQEKLVRQELEQRLYNIFYKYAQTRRKQEQNQAK